MQGRLSPLVDGRIQAFPWSAWKDEFPLAERHGFSLMEWTLDQDHLHENPLLTARGQEEIKTLSRRYGLRPTSLTGDCFMQAPFWKTRGEQQSESLKRDFQSVAAACAAVGIAIIVVPLVDNGRLENEEQENTLVAFLKDQAPSLSRHGLKVAFECDFAPTELARFMKRLDPAVFGVNYDIGNSASLGFDPNDEFSAYGHRILNVHVKDRVRGGTTVPLGEGHADFKTVFTLLHRLGYSGHYILQTARAAQDDHADVLCRYRDQVVDWLTRYAA